ncbi:hypothetical protein J2T09_002747 [Neorhizobium huautlense]|uniref:SHOCT domain-containing protein n=1 Tax=Neorhizobium huautlense TaxID=67774 RepID=A0ABT9PU38_9HYPH|nr:hypothetical protein [Neorhizobium huautlense]MDP9837987.1 hypothetical protein [Neorhizobium huautlense]
MEKMRHGFGRLSFVAALIAIPVGLSGCNSFALDDGIPNTAPQATVVPARSVTDGPVARKQGTGYPTFDGKLTAANTQIGDAEYSSQESQMSALARARGNGSISEKEYQRRVAELQAVAAGHVTDADAKISGN